MVSLRVADLDRSIRFYQSVIGLQVTAHMPGALFISAGGYHHHFGLNTWQSRGAGPAPEGTAGLISYTIVLPNTEARTQVVGRLEAHGISYTHDGADIVLQDPWRNQLVLAIKPGQGK